MDEIEKVFRDYKNYNTIEEFDRLDELLAENYGKRVISKEENGYIDIEYNNRMGEYKAKLLINYFEQNKEFYQYFLKKCSKVVIGTKNDTLSDEIFIDSNPVQFDTRIILEQILSDYKDKKYIGHLVEKIDQKKQLLSKDESLNFVSNLFLDNILKNRDIDFFTYLDLKDGQFINMGLCYQKAMMDIAFEYGYYGWLDLYMKNENIEEIQKYIFSVLYEKYSLTLFNKLLEKQVRLLDNASNQNESNFIKENLSSFVGLFQIEVPKSFAKYKKIESKSENIKLSREEIIKLVIEFLRAIDSTNQLVQEFTTNLDNGRILLWDKTNDDERKKAIDVCSKFYKANVDNPECLSKYKKNFEIEEILMNVPISNTLDSVRIVIHEFFHLHSELSKGKKADNHLLVEFPSIYFEELCRQFFVYKGYKSEDIDVNFRVIDSFENFSLVLPVLNYLSKYMERGYITDEILDEEIANVKCQIENECREQKLSPEETIKRFQTYGIIGSNDDIRKGLVYNLNYILLRYKRSIFSLSPYLLGVIFTNSAMENNCKVEEILKISDELNDIEDVVTVMRSVGIDVNKYGFSTHGKKNR